MKRAKVRAGGADPHGCRSNMEFTPALQDLTKDDLGQPGLVFQIGVPPVRIDVVTIEAKIGE
jgi:hypothetical protein